MAQLLNTDVLLVNRADTTYQMTFAELQQSVTDKLRNGITLSGDPLPTFENTDLFLVNRGDITYKLTFAELKDSIFIGIAPVLTNVSLVENNPGVSPRFTSQAFTASSNLSEDGIPQSEKTIDAFVEGAILTDAQFIEPLESSIVYGAWTTAGATAANNWSSVTYGVDKFVAVARSGANRVMYSGDGRSWTASTAAENNDWGSVTYGNGTFVAVASGGTNRVMYSTDGGVTWRNDSVTGVQPNQWKSVTYGGDKFVAVAASGDNRVMYSTNSINWTVASAVNNFSWKSVTYGNGKFVAISDDGDFRVMYSTDGISWTAASASEASDWRSVTYGGDKFVAVAADGTNRVMYSTDGISWTSASASESNNWGSVTYGNGKFVAVASGGTNRVMYSTDGISWTSAAVSADGAWFSVTHGDGTFVAVGSGGPDYVMWSLTGTGPTTDLTFANATDMVALAAGDVVSQLTETSPTYSSTLASGSGTYSTAAGKPQLPQYAFSPDVPGVPTGCEVGGDPLTDPLIWGVSSYGLYGKEISVMTGRPSLKYTLLLAGVEQYTTTLTPVPGVPVVIVPEGNTYDYDTIQILGTDAGHPAAINSVYVNGVQLFNDLTPTGTVGSVIGTTVNLATSSGTWVDNVDVTGPAKQLQLDGTKKYLDFDSNGNVSSLLDAPQSPAYITTDINPGLTLTFPATFPSGLTPDEELGDGTTLTVEVTAENDAGTSGPLSATVQPEFTPPPTNGLTTLYPGTSGNQSIVNGIDLVNNDGLVWIKKRTQGSDYFLFDTLRGPLETLYSNDTGGSTAIANTLTAFNDNGFDLGTQLSTNIANQNFVAWTFAKGAGYFDVVKYTGDGGEARSINHDLGTTPGCYITKGLDDGAPWHVFHTGLKNPDPT